MFLQAWDMGAGRSRVWSQPGFHFRKLKAGDGDYWYQTCLAYTRPCVRSPALQIYFRTVNVKTQLFFTDWWFSIRSESMRDFKDRPSPKTPEMKEEPSQCLSLLMDASSVLSSDFLHFYLWDLSFDKGSVYTACLSRFPPSSLHSWSVYKALAWPPMLSGLRLHEAERSPNTNLQTCLKHHEGFCLFFILFCFNLIWGPLQMTFCVCV